MRLGRYLGGLVSLALLCNSLMARPGHAQTVADFYSGRTINVYVGFSPGGAYDIYARQLARFMGSHLPGHPTLVPQNMTGAGGLTLANFLYNIAAKDGTAIGTFSRGLVNTLLLGTGVRYDPTKFFERAWRSLQFWQTRNCQRPAQQPGLADIAKVVLRSIWHQGLRSSYRRPYWKYLLRLVTRCSLNPVKIWIGFTILIAGHHFIPYAKEVVQRVEGDIAEMGNGALGHEAGAVSEVGNRPMPVGSEF